MSAENPKNGYVPKKGEMVRFEGACPPRLIGRKAKVIDVHVETDKYESAITTKYFEPSLREFVYSGGELGGVVPITVDPNGIVHDVNDVHGHVCVIERDIEELMSKVGVLKHKINALTNITTDKQPVQKSLTTITDDLNVALIRLTDTYSKLGHIGLIYAKEKYLQELNENTS